MEIYNYPSIPAELRVQAIVDRLTVFKKEDIESVTRIIEDVKKNKDAALIQYSNKFDSPHFGASSLVVTAKEFKTAAEQVKPSLVTAIKRAASQIKTFHEKQRETSWVSTPRAGTFLGQLVNPVGAAGVYVPGGQSGKTPLVSSVLMGCIPAKVAGVDKIVMVTPPKTDGTVDPHLLVAAELVDVDAVYKVGSAWAIAALAYGTETIPAVDVIVGPGNIYVMLAKKLCAGNVGIDMIAGPSEILVIADDTANPKFIAADLLSQAEHDPLSSAILVTPSKKLAAVVMESLDKQLEHLPRKEIAIKSLNCFGTIMIVSDLESAMELSNRIAPEHLELQVKAPFDWVGKIRNAGAVFLGHFSPEPMGDYIAGPNHVLPTAGTARFSSPLSVDHFTKKTSLIHYSEEAFYQEADDVIRLADMEGLNAHARAVKVRIAEKGR